MSWIVGNGNHDRWRSWSSCGPIWVDTKEAATRYARREDAELVHAEDEDAWSVVEFPRDGLSVITGERERQIGEEHRSPADDRRHAKAELARAAACYAMPTGYREGSPPQHWPWHESWWKPSPDDRIRDLAKAGALVAAEIDRLLAAKR